MRHSLNHYVTETPLNHRGVLLVTKYESHHSYCVPQQTIRTSPGRTTYIQVSFTMRIGLFCRSLFIFDVSFVEDTTESRNFEIPRRTSNPHTHIVNRVMSCFSPQNIQQCTMRKWQLKKFSKVLCAVFL